MNMNNKSVEKKSKLDLDKKVTKMGYITKSTTANNYRGRYVGSSLVKKAVDAMGGRRHTKKGHSKAMVEVTLKIGDKDARISEKYRANVTFHRIIDDNVILQDHKQKVVRKAGSIQRPETWNVSLQT